MNKTRFLLTLSLAITALLLAACGTPPVNNWPGLSVDSEKAYLAAGAHVYAVELSTGSEAWRYPTEPNNKHQFFIAPSLTPDGQLLVGSAGTEHVFISLDPATGKENWAAPFLGSKGPWMAAPLVFEDQIYAPNADGTLYILDLQGSLVDSIELGGSLWSKPVTDGRLVYVASLDHHLHIIDPSLNENINTVDMGGAIPGGATAAADGVYVGSFTGRLEAVSSSGQNQTLAESEDWIWGAPALKDDTLYFADLGGRVYSLDLIKDVQNWSDIKPNGPIAASLLPVDDMVVIVTESGEVYAYDPQGKEIWPRPYAAGGNLYTSPVAAADLILVAPYHAEYLLIALDREGRLVWEFPPKEANQ
ncbi:MAG: hypothetical protein A2Y54_10090 [Chloroflexi bacterium RBG_16_51_16]|nr:MAG: hypothetical protein A2Y54_10090 [Chloroflexi bacterium RBG_16_51_16]